MFGFTSGELSIALIIAIALMIGLWGPYLYEEIVRGKAKEGSYAPLGAGDTHPGTRQNPAPGHIETQIDPYADRSASAVSGARARTHRRTRDVPHAAAHASPSQRQGRRL